MGKFMKDYANLYGHQMAFNKEHWKGRLLLSVAVVAGQFAWMFREPIKNTIKEKLTKKNKVEVTIDDEILEGEIVEES